MEGEGINVDRKKRDKLKEVISILILSPLYFSIPIRKRLEFINELMERHQL